jgi:small subunit ribosomal protein S6
MVVGLEEWGRRKLAFKVKGTVRGFYVLADFAGVPGTIKELERNYRIDDRIIRYQTLKKSDKVNLEALQEEIAARAEKAAPAPEPEAAPPGEEAVSLPEEAAAQEISAEAPPSQGKED